MLLAPIVLFTYNRLHHTVKTVEALSKNYLASESDLIIFSDGPKSELDATKVAEVRTFLKQIHGFKSVSIIEQSQNKGLASSIIDGVTEVVNKFGRIIVIEDDVLSSPYFLSYMNKSLNFFLNNKKIISIGSWNYFHQSEKDSEYFLLRLPDSIAWATWSDRWCLFEKDTHKLKENIDDLNLKNYFNLDGAYDYYQMLNDQINAKISSWCIRWTAVACINQMLTVYPAQSMTKHIGFDGGTHCQGEDWNINLQLSKKEIILVENRHFEDNNFLESRKAYFQVSLFSKLKSKFINYYNFFKQKYV